VRRIRDGQEEQVASTFAQAVNEVTVVLDGPGLEDDWQSLLGELFLFTTAPALAGRYVPEGFELARIPDGSMLLAVGIRRGDVLVEIDGLPPAEIIGESLPLSAVDGHIDVTVLRNEKSLRFTLLAG